MKPSTDADLDLDLHLRVESKLTPEQEEALNLIDEIVQEELSSSPPEAQPMPILYELLVYNYNYKYKLQIIFKKYFF